MSDQHKANTPIFLSRNADSGRELAEFFPEQLFCYQLAGSTYLDDGNNTLHVQQGQCFVAARNRLVKISRTPSLEGEFKCLVIRFGQDVLDEFANAYHYSADEQVDTTAFSLLSESPRYKSLANSLINFLLEDELEDSDLTDLKLKEALLILLKVNPELKDTLFDFRAPEKADLSVFMEKNFRFKVNIEHFAYLSGRSLATFKRDFDKTLEIAPNRWLIRRRLQEAYMLLKDQGKRPSQVYLEVGFEDFSHFCQKFRQAYGVSPAKVI